MTFQIFLLSVVFFTISAQADKMSSYYAASAAAEIDGSASMAYKAGIMFASTASAFVNEGNAVWEDEEAGGDSDADCQRRTSSQLSDQLREMLNFRGNLLAQTLYGTSSARAGICRVYSSQTGAMKRCLAAEEAPLAPILMILQTICVQFNEVLSETAECLSDMDYANLEEQCVTACQPPTAADPAPAPTVEMTPGSNYSSGDFQSATPPAYKPTDAAEAMTEVCDVAACAFNCVGASISECGESGPSAVGSIKQFNDQIYGLQMLYAISTQIQNPVGISAMLRSGIPPKCGQIVTKAIASANFVAGHDIQPQEVESSNTKYSFMELLNGKNMGENFARA